MKITATHLSNVLLIEPDFFSDHGELVYESFQAKCYQEHGIRENFVQDNISCSHYGTLRGLHYQLPYSQAKLVYVAVGCVIDVVVDLRVGSPTFMEHLMIELSDKNYKQLYIPPGFAHGFLSLSEGSEFIYKCSNYYNPLYEYGFAWNDPDLAIQWPIKTPILSSKDQYYPSLKGTPKENLFSY